MRAWPYLLLGAGCISTFVGPSWARGVRVRGDAVVAAHARFTEEGRLLETSILATDDDDVPLPNLWLELRGVAGATERVEACVKGNRTPTVHSGEWLRVRTDAAGAACLRLGSVPDKGTLVVRFGGDLLHGATESSVVFDRHHSQLKLLTFRHIAPSLTIAIESKTAAFSAALNQPDGSAPRATGLQVQLILGADKELAQATTDAKGTVEFNVATSALGPPGPERLRFVFQGDAEHEPAHAETTLTKTARVVLALPTPPKRVVAGEELVLDATVEHQGGSVNEGGVEVLSGAISLVSSPVIRGVAHLVVAIEPRAHGSLPLTLRYLPSATYLRAESPLHIDLPVGAPGFASRGWFVLLVAAAAGAVFSSWRRSRAATERSGTPAPLLPGVYVRENLQTPGRFRGRVVDAHEGTPVAAVDVIVRHATLDGDGILAREKTDANGAFAFELPPHHRAELRIETRSRLHISESQALPRGGSLVVLLTTRRRALLARFVRWTTRAGPPFDTATEATPAEIRALATERPDLWQWSNAIERAAFGPKEVDAALEAQVRAVEPR